MTVQLTKPIQGGSVRAIASKAEAHRLLICAALADGESFVECRERCEDIDATVRSLEALGASFRYESQGFRVISRSAGLQEEKNKGRYALDCGESGSTLRFLLPVCGALSLPVSFYMGGQLPVRPLTGLYEEMTSHGCKLSAPGTSPLACEGSLKSGIYTLPGNISSQFVSGLLFSLPMLQGESVIRITDILQSRPYVDMTLDAIKMFGIMIYEENERIFRIPGGQKFRSVKYIRAGGDWSNAAFWLAAGAIGDARIVCTGLDLSSRQGDKAVIELLERFGACVTIKEDAVTVSKENLKGIDIDAGNTPDLVPILAAVAAVAQGKTNIYNAARLRIKESDRLHTVCASLKSLGADIEETKDGLVINGKENLPGGETKSFGDHRIAMAAAVLSSACTGTVQISGAEAVRKSYPGFFDDFCALGGEIT
ncbi:MAG: 3-phosphoshikimate 1-carboxyvinyltransferase [Oscillospiraceae bacterium]|nr:3-phosphoshikimate 1-carboxyvinyltransferase [Oscillospiraceae bacterium]